MRVGDLVRFQTKAWVFEYAKDRYANPGVVLKIDPYERDWSKHRFSATVYWADGKVTEEYDSYLQPVNKVEKN